MATTVILKIKDDLLQDIEDYQYAFRMRSRAAAIRKLILIGVLMNKEKPPSPPVKTSVGEF